MLPRLKYLYLYCNDVKKMKEFYTDLLGMKETYFQNDEQYGVFCFDSEGLEVMFFRVSGNPLPVATAWASQPADDGTFEFTSWAIQVGEEDFNNIVERIKNDLEIPKRSGRPNWRVNSYWGINIQDPMGNTIELFTIPKEKPEKTEWDD